MNKGKDKRKIISAIILRGGDEDKELVGKCLKSVGWVDEIIEVETDKLEGSFAEWRNAGAKRTHGEWLLYLDTDEEVSADLKKEIVLRIKNYETSSSAYAIPRANIFLGHKMKWGGWYPDYVIRLIKKDKLEGWYGDLHEQPRINGELGYLINPLIHTTHRSLLEMVSKTNKWSDIEAKLLYDSQHPPMNLIRFTTAGFREFWFRGIKKLGFLDGTIGIIEIIYQTFSKLITYMKLWELQKINKNSQMTNN